MGMNMSLEERLYTLAACVGILAIAGIVHLFQKHIKDKKLQQSLQQKKREEEAASKQDKNAVSLFNKNDSNK